MAPIIALIVAAGRGLRAGVGLPKQYQRLSGVSLLRRTIIAFIDHPRVDHIKVVVHPDDEALYFDAVADLDLLPPVAGGDTRAQSVANGLASALAAVPLDQATTAVVLVHDAARPFVSAAVIDRCLEAMASLPEGTKAGVVPALAVTDSVRRGRDRLTSQIDRSDLLRVQTPQCFNLVDLKFVSDRAEDDGRAHTDEAGLMMEHGYTVHVVEGDERNLKLTTADDFTRAEEMLAARTSVRIGMGFDVHAFEPGDHVWIGGLKIPHDRALKGHSDADVALHALTDALLGAISAGDIGTHFPPSDPQWRGAASHLFLEHARDLIAAQGGRIEHVDVTVICEAPKIGPHRDAMRDRIAGLLRLPLGRVSVKATTTERLGFTGRGEGIAAQAVATVRVEEGDLA